MRSLAGLTAVVLWASGLGVAGAASGSTRLCGSLRAGDFEKAAVDEATD